LIWGRNQEECEAGTTVIIVIIIIVVVVMLLYAEIRVTSQKNDADAL